MPCTYRCCQAICDTWFCRSIFGKKSQEQLINILRVVFEGSRQKNKYLFIFPFFSPRHAQQCYSRVGARVGGMYGMNNKYSIEHPVTWKAIQGRQGKIVIPPRYFLLFLFPTSTSETFFFKKDMYIPSINTFLIGPVCEWMLFSSLNCPPWIFLLYLNLHFIPKSKSSLLNFGSIL